MDRDRLFRIVRTLGSERSNPLLLSAAIAGRESLATICVALERIEFRALVGDLEQNRIAMMYFDVAALLHAKNLTPNQAVAELEEWVVTWADDKSFMAALPRALTYGTHQSNNYIKNMLTSIDDHRAWLDGSRPWPPKPAKSHVWDMAHVEDEHIYPQRPEGGVPTRLTTAINRLGNRAFWGPADNKAKEASNRLPTDPEKIKAYQAASPKSLNSLGVQLAQSGRWGKAEESMLGNAPLSERL